MMRRILVDWTRSRQALKRGGEARALDLDSEALAAANQPGMDLVALDDALNALSAIDARKGRVVELRFLHVALAVSMPPRYAALSLVRFIAD
jgi:RNA polymerase sigma-70 factor (ECF subfamily)